MIPKAAEVGLTLADRAVLEARVRAPTTEQRDVFRARIILLADEEGSTRSIARTLGTMPRTVSSWRGRFAREGMAGLSNKAHPGPAPTYNSETGRRILAVLDREPAGFARWTGALIAAELGDVHEQDVWRFLRAQKIDLAGRKSWCESDDPEFVAKAADVMGLDMAPPENAIVISVDEKPSIQALERAQGYLKLPNGRALTGHSHDYKRNGTSTLFAALEVATGKVTAAHKNRRRSCRIPRFHERYRRRPLGHGNPCDPRQPQHPQAQERSLVEASSERAFSLHPDASLLAQPGGDLVLHPGRKVPAWRFLHIRQTAQGAHRCLH
jgi:transposase